MIAVFLATCNTEDEAGIVLGVFATREAAEAAVLAEAATSEIDIQREGEDPRHEHTWTDVETGGFVWSGHVDEWDVQ